MRDESILWRRLDTPGHECARLMFAKPFWRLMGTANFLHEEKPTQLAYDVICDANWRTLSGTVDGWVGRQPIQVEISVDSARQWRINGKRRRTLAGCLDLDLNFSPSTNLLPIRRLHLAIGQEATVNAAWLRFPDFTLEPLEQLYRRTARLTYRYVSAGGTFVRGLHVNRTGFVTSYPGLWRIEERRKQAARF